MVLLKPPHLQVHIYPDTPANQKDLRNAEPSLHIPLRTNAHGQQRILGHQLVRDANLTDKPVAYPTWSFALPSGEAIQHVLSPSRGPVASIGKVLGNRTTLYKYLNPRLLTVLTTSTSVSPPTCGLYLVDSAKGTIVYRATVPSASGVCDVQASFTENWLVYHYFDEDFAGVGQSKGYRMVTVELYEGRQADDKTRR